MAGTDHSSDTTETVLMRDSSSRTVGGYAASGRWTALYRPVGRTKPTNPVATIPGPTGATATAAACAGPSRLPRYRSPPAARSPSTTWCTTRSSGWSGAGRSWPTSSSRCRRCPVPTTASWTRTPKWCRWVASQSPRATGPTGSSSTGARSRSARKNRDERALLVHEVVVEQVAELLGLAPESVDPRYGQD